MWVVDSEAFTPLIGRRTVHLSPIKVDPDLERHLVGDDGGGCGTGRGVGEVGPTVPVWASTGPWGLSSTRDSDPILATAVSYLSYGRAGAGGDLTDLEAGGGEAGVGDAAVSLLRPSQWWQWIEYFYFIEFLSDIESVALYASLPDTDVILLVGQMQAIIVVLRVDSSRSACRNRSNQIKSIRTPSK